MTIFLTGSSGIIAFHLPKKILDKGHIKLTLSDTILLKKITGYSPKTKYKLRIKKFLKWYSDYYKNLSSYYAC